MEADALREDGRTEEAGDGREGLSLGFGYGSPHLHHQQHQKLLRSDAFPFRLASSSHAATGVSTASDGRAGPPPSHRTLASPPNSGVGGGGGPAALGHGGISDSDSYGTPRALRPVNPPGLPGDATLQLCSSFTAAQWQELHRQALIFKCIVTSTPVPPDLLLTHSPFPDGHGHPFFPNLSRGGDYLNLRFTGANGDLEPGRCRRTDGKKWRCSRDVAPGQKYCERHVHRARPRSRKPVELDGRADPAAAANTAETVSTTSGAIKHGAPSTTAKPAAARPSAQSSPGLPASGADLKFPFQFMVPEDKKLKYLGSSGGGHAEAQPATQQWQLLHSKMGLQQQQQQHHGDNQLNLRCNSLNDHHGCPFPSTDISTFDTDPHDRRDTPRRFIDAWSRSENPFNGVTIGDGYKTNSGDGSCCIRSLGNLSPSNLTLSMPGTGVGGGEHHDHFQMGIRATDSGKMLAPSWMSTVSPIGGPLAEVLQTSSTVSFRNERAGHENDAAPRGSGGLIDLMCKTSCDSEGTSPRRGFSSPTRVLQKALVSLSDSSSNSSPTFGLGRRPELGLQWSSPSN